MENLIAQRIDLLQTESAFDILAHANALEAQGRSVIHCEIGQPDFPTPENIVEAGIKALRDGYTGYGPTPGFPDVREVIAEDVMRRKNIRTDAEEIVIVPGGKPVMFFTMLMLVDPGDEVIYPNPGFPIYESCIRFAGGVPVPMPLLHENDFRADIGRLRESVTERTKLIILNSPSNPTGGVFTREDVEAIAQIVREHPRIYVLADEIYDQLAFDGSVISIASLPGMKDRTVILDGFSKAYAMTGWRIGYGVMNHELAQKMALLMVNSNSCTASFTQRAAMEAIQGPQDSVAYMREQFRIRRDWVVAALNRIDGVRCRMPGGAFYAFPEISSFGLNSKTFCDRLLEEEGVAAAWGTSFGEYGEGHFRLSFANSLDNLKIAVERIARFAEKLRTENTAGRR